MQPLQICIGPIIRIGRESWCLPYAGFFSLNFGIGATIQKRQEIQFAVTKAIKRKKFHKRFEKAVVNR